MAPEESAKEITNLLVSVNQSGSSDGRTLLEAYKILDESLNNVGVPRPVLVITDGHGSRFDYNVLKFLHEKNMWLYILYPDTSGATQMHDQLNAQLHRVYELEKANLYSNFAPIDREAFMKIMAPTWKKWASSDQLKGAARRVGITSTSGINVNWMQQEKFQMAENILHPPVLMSCQSTPFEPKSPQHVRSGSAKSIQAKLDQAMERVRTLEKVPPLESIEGLLPYQQIQPKKKTKNRRITQEHGSMRAVDMLNKVAELQRNEELKKEKKLNAAVLKENKIKDFNLCRDVCSCDEIPCRAKNLKMCSICSDVLLSQCNKVKCREAAAAKDMKCPVMINTSSVTSRKRKRGDEEDLIEESSNDDDSDTLSMSEEEDIDIDFVPLKRARRKLPPRKLAPSFTSDVILEKSKDDSILAAEIEDIAENYPGPSKVCCDAEKDDANEDEDVLNDVVTGCKGAREFLKERDCINQWFAIDYPATKKKKRALLIGKVIERKESEIKFHCLKPKYGPGDIVEDTPALRPDDFWGDLSSVFRGPLEVIYIGKGKYNVNNYQTLVKHHQVFGTLNEAYLF